MAAQERIELGPITIDMSRLSDIELESLLDEISKRQLRQINSLAKSLLSTNGSGVCEELAPSLFSKASNRVE